MSEFARIHTALFDELERQGVLGAGIDIGRLTAAAVAARAVVERPPLRIEPANPRCANGSCE